MEPKRKTDDKHAIILWSPRQLSETFRSKRYVIDILKKSPPEIKSALCGKSLPSSLVS